MKHSDRKGGNKMRNKKIFIITAAFLLIALSSIKPAMAYFTDTETARGTVVLNVGKSTIVPDEEIDQMVKIVTISNQGDYDVFVRAKALYGSNYRVTIKQESIDNGWSYNSGDGYFYYGGVLAPEESAPELKLDVSVINSDIVTDFNVVIVQEGARAIYDADGGVSCDWTQTQPQLSDNYAAGQEVR